MSDICASTLIATGWSKPAELASLPRDQWRPALVEAMARRGIGEKRELKTRLNNDLALAARVFQHLRDAGVNPSDLAAMGVAARREVLLKEIHERRGTPFASMRFCDDRRLLDIAENGLIADRLAPLVSGIEAVAGAAPAAYGLADDDGRDMEALRLLLLPAGGFLGIYHSRVGDALRLQAATSDNLVNWSRIAELGDHNRNGDISPMGDGFLVANQLDETGRGSHLRFRYYESLEKLAADEPLNDRDIPLSLSRWGEGAPDIRLVEGDNPEKSDILAGFNFRRRAGAWRRVDRLATGILTGFDRWTSWVDVPANRALSASGFQGNFGSSCAFPWAGGVYYIQEAQLEWKDWTSWRVLLGNGQSYIRLTPRTAGASRSFTNPCIAYLGETSYAAAFFLPHHGNVPGEDGELVFRFTTG